jgi:hypothetical protein
MHILQRSKRCLSPAVAFSAALGLTVPAGAADFSLDFPAGLACSFELRIDGTGGNQVYREFVDRNGVLVRSITAGTGSALTFTNVGTGAALSTRSNGAVTHISYNPDGSATYVTTGHNVLILFPTDIPAGPTTTLYVGRVVFTADRFFNFNLLGHSGTATDICAGLS